MKVNYYHRKNYNKYFKSLCNTIQYKNSCDKKVITQLKKSQILKSDTYLIKKLKLDGDTDPTVFKMIENI